MNYFVYINGTTHKLVQGFTISEEYNETLDSANIVISDSPQLDINPYDDVFIYSEYCGYYDIDEEKIVPNYNKKFVFKGYPVSSPLYNPDEMPFFYKHFLIDQFTESMLILGDNHLTSRYQYKIDLFSETKGLETIQAPNISITQPLTKDKVSTLSYVLRYLTLYNKKIKESNDENKTNQNTFEKWDSTPKYSIAEIDNKKIIAFEDLSGEVKGDYNYHTFLAIEGLNGNVVNAEEIPESDYSLHFLLKLNDVRYFKFSSDSEELKIVGSYKRIRACYDSYKYPTLLETFESVFKNSYTPDFTLNNPSLRQILEKLAITKDCIPVVRDDQIFVMDITKRRGNFDSNKGQINYIIGSKSSDNFCTDLKRTYSDALTQENSTRYVEYLGFRNSDTALLTLDNLRIETKFPIYKINKIYMCYFKKIKYTNLGASEEKVFLCKQDITPLVKLNSERNVLSQDIEELNSESYLTIEEMANYKMCTVGYDIGSNYITGWGTQYSYPGGFFWQTKVKSYIENLFKYMNKYNMFGIYEYDFLAKRIREPNDNTPFSFVPYSDIKDNIVISESEYSESESWIKDLWDSLHIGGNDANMTLYLKHLFFHIDYQGFYNGTVIHSKGLGKDNLTINDNPSASLSLLELDGLSQKEKLDRYGNKGLQINARYNEVGDVQSLGSVYEHDNDEDVIIFHKQYAINSNVVNCTYYGSKDYVLKNYFTSVYAKHRTYNLMGYAESVTRSENQKLYLIVSKDKKIKDSDLNFSFTNFGENSDFLQKLFSFYNPSVVLDYEILDESNKINYGYFENNDGKMFATDINFFVSGNSLCMNIRMNDNITCGTSIDKMRNKFISFDTSKYVIGSTQKWVNLVDNMETGSIQTMSFTFGHASDIVDDDKVYDFTDFENVVEKEYEKLKALPEIIESPKMSNKISFKKDIFKDNKEKIDMTLQIEPISDNNIYISPWLSKLSDLFSVYEKHDKNEEYKYSKIEEKFKSNIYLTEDESSPIVALVVNIEDDNWTSKYEGDYIDLKGGISINLLGITGSGYSLSYGQNFIRGLSYTFKTINEVTTNNIKVNGEFTINYYKYPSNYSGSGNSELNFGKQLISISQTNGVKHSASIYDTFKSSLLENLGLSDDSYDVFVCRINDDASDLSSDGFTTFKGLKWAGDYTNGKVIEQFPSFSANATGDLLVKELKQNIFWVITPPKYEFKEHMVYDEFDDLPDDFKHLIISENSEDFSTNVGEILIEPNKDEIKFHHEKNIPEGSHILCYYKSKDDKYKFVFGFKPNYGTLADSTTIYLSLTSFKDLTVYDKKTRLPIGNVSTSID